MAKDQVFINQFQKGISQSANLGIQTIVGMDAYSKPGAIILGKAITTTYQFGSSNEYPTYMDVSNSSNLSPQVSISGRLWVQTNIGTVYYSDNYGITWTQVVITSPPGGSGNGLIVYENYVFLFFNTVIYYAQADALTPSFTSWKTSIDSNTFSAATSPIGENHFPVLFPNGRGFYFTNNNAIGFVGQVFPVGAVTPTAFNPAGTINTDYIYLPTNLNLPRNYSTNVLNSLPPGNLAIGTNNLYSGQEGNIFTWDTRTANGFSYPINLYSGVNVNGSQGVKQATNRLNTMYVAMGGNHALYQTNGATADIIADFSLYSNIRNGLLANNGGEYPIPVYFNSYPSAIAVSGNRILTGTGVSANNSYYPASNVGVFPTGVWSVYLNEDGTFLKQMEYSVNFLPGLEIAAISSFSSVGDYSAITTINPLPNGQLAVGYVVLFAGGVTLGSIAIFDNVQYISDLSYTSLESEMFEIGTALNPVVPGNIEINLIKNLLAGQVIEVSYRISNDQNWSVIATGTFTGDGTKNYYSIQKHGIGRTRYLQIRIRMKTGSPNPNSTPELRNIIIGV